MFFNKKRKLINISGMSCKNCARKIKLALESIPEIDKVKVNLTNNEAIIYYKTSVQDDEIKRKIEELEYKVTGIKKIN